MGTRQRGALLVDAAAGPQRPKMTYLPQPGHVSTLVYSIPPRGGALLRKTSLRAVFEVPPCRRIPIIPQAPLAILHNKRRPPAP